MKSAAVTIILILFLSACALLAQSQSPEEGGQAPSLGDCGKQGQPECGPCGRAVCPCGSIGEDCCEIGNGAGSCRKGLACDNGTCRKTPFCGGLGEACCMQNNPSCDSPLTKCKNNVCTGGTIVTDLKIELRTNDEDKDDNTGVRVAVDGLASWSQTSDLHYDDWSTHTWSLTPSAVLLSDLAGRYVSICIQPQGLISGGGNDTWKFNFRLSGARSDHLGIYEVRKDNVFLSTDVPCLSWDATPASTPKGSIAENGQCLSADGSTAITQSACAGTAAQEWTGVPESSTPAPDGARVGHIHHSSGKCLGLANGSTTNGTAVELQDCGASFGQEWKWFGGRPNQITGPLSKCLDPGGTSNLPQYKDCDGSSAQIWSLPACGGSGQACCENGLPCEGVLSCSSQNVCGPNGAVNGLRLSLETTNEDKDDNTKAVLTGVTAWSIGGDTHFDDWSTHDYPVTPSSTPWSSVVNGQLTLRSTPDGSDNWKLNFLVNGTRDDGSHYEFRKDNVWLANGDRNDPLAITWALGPPPLDLIWTDVDANGLPLNPTWRGFEQGKACDGECLDAFKVCPYHASPLVGLSDINGGTVNDYGRCSSQSPTYDRSSYCGWHANWFPATFDGTAQSADFSSFPGDGDWHVDLEPLSDASNIGRPQLLAEFDSDETTEHFQTHFWASAQDLHKLIHDNQARITGLVGIDTEHDPPGGHGEIHPVYLFSLRMPGGSIPSNGDTWGIFVRNWGDEGACGASQHYFDMREFTMRFAAPPGAEEATSVVESLATEFRSGTENDPDWSGGRVSQLSPIQHEISGGKKQTYVEMTFNIDTPESHSYIEGSLTMVWMCGANVCPAPPPQPASPARKVPEVSEVDNDAMPGAELLTLDQTKVLQQQAAARPRRTMLDRPVTRFPFVKMTPQMFNVGQGSMSDRSVSNPAREARELDIQKAVCRMLANNPKRPSICK